MLLPRDGLQSRLERFAPSYDAHSRRLMRRWNLALTPTRPVIEQLWQAIDQENDWQPLHRWLDGLTN